MFTPEQIKNLKPGDTLNLNNYPVSYVCAYPDGTINANDDRAEECCNTSCYFPVQYLSIPPKHDPCRLFKKGDIVKYEPRHGRFEPGMSKGTICTVLSNEIGDGRVFVEYGTDEGVCTATIPFFFLELVTPVEELEPYYIEEKDIEFQVRMKYEDKDCLISVFRFKNIVEGYKQYYDMLPTMKQARKAAEAECDRLNAEYQQKHQN